MNVETLAWDTEFFGIPIGRARVAGDLGDVIDDAQSQNIQCVYIETKVELLPIDGLVLVDTRVRLECPPELRRSDGADRVRAGDTGDITMLGLALDRLAPWSRFSRDSRFGTVAALRMYRAWLGRAATSANEAFGVLDLDNRPNSFITIATAVPAEIGLIATGSPGRGFGRSLIRWASQQCDPSVTISVVTQAENAPALALYLEEGFSVVARSHLYHLWLDNHVATHD